MIVLEGLCKKYISNKKTDVTVFDKANFVFPSKGLVTLTGKSGSGKSTLFNILGGIDPDFEGSVKSFGIDLNNCNLSKYRRECIGFIFQDFSLIENLTIFENLKLVLSEQKNYSGDIENKIDSVLIKLGLLDLKTRYPNQISGGEAQRVAIARALIKDVKFILADEPTGNLDKENAIEVLNLLKVVSKDKLVILVTHDVDLASDYSSHNYSIEEIKEGVSQSQTISQSNSLIKDGTRKKVSSFVFTYPLRLLVRNSFGTLLMNVLLFFVLFSTFLALKSISITKVDILFEYFQSNQNETYTVQEVTVIELDNGGFAVRQNSVTKDVYETYEMLDYYVDNNNILFTNRIRYEYTDNEGFERPLVTNITLLENSDDYAFELLIGRLPREEDEIIITDYMSMIFFGTVDTIGNHIEGVLNTGYSNDFLIVGILETDYEKQNIPIGYSDFITMFEYTAVISPTSRHTYFELSKYIQSYTLLETYSLKDNQHLLGSEAYLNINCDACEQNYRITRSINSSPDYYIYGSYPERENEILFRIDLLREILTNNTNEIDQLLNEDITWSQFVSFVDLPIFYNDIALESGIDFWEGVLPAEYEITGVYELSDVTIEIMYVSPILISNINEKYPFKNIGINVIEPLDIMNQLMDTDFNKDIASLFEPNTGAEQIVFNGLNSYSTIQSQYKFFNEIKPLMRIAFIVSLLLGIILMLLHSSNSHKINGRSTGILMSLGFSKFKLMIAMIIETIYLLLIPFVLSITILFSFSSQLSKIFFSSELKYSIYQYSVSDVIQFLMILSIILLIGLIPRLLMILTKSPIDLIQKR